MYKAEAEEQAKVWNFLTDEETQVIKHPSPPGLVLYYWIRRERGKWHHGGDLTEGYLAGDYMRKAIQAKGAYVTLMFNPKQPSDVGWEALIDTEFADYKASGSTLEQALYAAAKAWAVSPAPVTHPERASGKE